MADTAEVDFDVIVVGAGIAGCVTAYQLAQQGHSVVLIERGAVPGSKNLSGGVLYCQAMQEVFPGFLDDAPFERRVTRNSITFLNAGSSVAIDYRDNRLADPVNAVTVLRAKFDPWLARKCDDAGVFLMPGVRVDRVLTGEGADSKRVIGVQAGTDELRARVVVAADGVNSFLSRQAGLRNQPATDQLAVGVKCVVSLPRATIEDRFNLVGDDGAAVSVVGDCTEGVGGGGFMYTNTESISIGVVLRLDDLLAKKGVASDIFEHFLGHPFIAPYLDGGEIIEYGSHLIAEGGFRMIGDLTTDGMITVGEAAGLSLNTGLTVRGMDLAVGSAVAAAQGISAALERNDTSKSGLAGYEEQLFASYVGRDMRTYAKAPSFLERDRMYQNYGDLLAEVLYGEFNLDTEPRHHLFHVAREALIHSPVKLRQLVSDGIAGERSL